MVLCVSLALSATASAAGFKNLGNYIMKPVMHDTPWKRSFDTQNGTLTVKYRNLPQNGRNGQGHIILQMNGQEFYSAYCPATQDGVHRMSIFQDNSSGKLLFALYLDNRILIWGYDSHTLAAAGYVDSNRLPNNGESKPVIRVDEDGDLEVLFTSNSIEYGKRFKLFWDSAKQGVGYHDVTRVYVEPVINKQTIIIDYGGTQGGNNSSGGGCTTAWEEVQIQWE